MKKLYEVPVYFEIECDDAETARTEITNLLNEQNFEVGADDDQLVSGVFIGPPQEIRRNGTVASDDLLAALQNLYSMGQFQRTISNGKQVGNAYHAARVLIDKAKSKETT